MRMGGRVACGQRTMRVAVVGSGIAGLSAAWLLSQQHEVTIFEKSARLGMDAHSLDIETPDGAARVDVPLRVFFDGFYPNVSALYHELGIEFQPINYSASFGLLGEKTYFRFDNYKVGRYAVPFLRGSRSLNWTSLRIGWDNIRFFRQLGKALANGIADDVTLEIYLLQNNYSQAFTEGFLYPAFAGICTCSHESVKAYPARVILEYLSSDLLFSSVQRVIRGTQEVVGLLAKKVHQVELGAAVESVGQTDRGVTLRAAGAEAAFDHVVMATQANQTSQILANASDEERQVLRAFRYEPSRVVVHKDPRLAPPGGAKQWAPVNFLLAAKGSTPMATILLNAIQAIPGHDPVYQTWNPIIEPETTLTLGEAHFERPIVSTESLAALGRLAELHNAHDRRIWFCGSYASHGIPLLESAATSALSVAERLGCTRPWTLSDAATAPVLGEPTQTESSPVRG